MGEVRDRSTNFGAIFRKLQPGGVVLRHNVRFRTIARRGSGSSRLSAMIYVRPFGSALSFSARSLFACASFRSGLDGRHGWRRPGDTARYPGGEARSLAEYQVAENVVRFSAR